MIYNNKKYRNLESQVQYLTDYLDTEAQLVNLQIRVIGQAESAEDLPETAENYGDAFMIGTETPYNMYIWTRGNDSEPEDHWFNAGKFPQPGTTGEAGEGFKEGQNLTFSSSEVTYDGNTGATVTGTVRVLNEDETVAATLTPSNILIPIVAGDGVSVDASEDGEKIVVKADVDDLSEHFVPLKTNTSVNTQVYAKTTSGSQGMLTVVSTSTGNEGTIVSRASGGYIKARTPASNDDVATKKYVDDAVSGGGGGGSTVYQHDITFRAQGPIFDEWDYITMEFRMFKKTSAVVTTAEGLVDDGKLFVSGDGYFAESDHDFFLCQALMDLNSYEKYIVGFVLQDFEYAPNFKPIVINIDNKTIKYNSGSYTFDSFTITDIVTQM